MNDSFPATIKLITGEEILAEVTLMDEDGSDFFLVNDPIVISEAVQVDHQKGIAVSGLVPKKWQLYSNDSMTIINKQHIISISELDKFGTQFYNQALVAAKVSSPIERKVETEENVGYVGNTKDSREFLEKMYEMSHDVSDDPLA